MMIGKVHKLVDEIWLIQVTCQRAEFFVSGQAVAANNNGCTKEVDRETKYILQLTNKIILRNS